MSHTVLTAPEQTAHAHVPIQHRKKVPFCIRVKSTIHLLTYSSPYPVPNPHFDSLAEGEVHIIIIPRDGLQKPHLSSWRLSTNCFVCFVCLGFYNLTACICNNLKGSFMFNTTEFHSPLLSQTSSV